MRKHSREDRMNVFVHPSARVFSVNPGTFKNKSMIYIVQESRPIKDLAVIGAAKPSYQIN